MAKTMEDEEVPFLDHGSDSRHTKKSHTITSSLLSTCRGLSLLLFLLLSANLITFAANLKIRSSSITKLQSSRESLLSNSPINDLVTYEDRQLGTHYTNSPYTGLPRPEFDEAWAKLLNYTLVEVTADELRAINKTSLQIKGSGNYLANLDVHHQLHCLKRMVQIRHPENYAHLIEMGKLSDAHFDHCIDHLRQVIMCQADLQINTFEWHQTAHSKFDTNVNHLRRCANWDRIEEWARSRYPGQHFEFVKENGFGIQGPID